MNKDKDFLGRIFSFIKTSFGVYLIFIILIILFPPVDYYERPKFPVFSGWWFIVDVGGDAKINIIYFLSEIGIVTLVYFMYLQSRKK